MTILNQRTKESPHHFQVIEKVEYQTLVWAKNEEDARNKYKEMRLEDEVFNLAYDAFEGIWDNNLEILQEDKELYEDLPFEN